MFPCLLENHFGTGSAQLCFDRIQGKLSNEVREASIYERLVTNGVAVSVRSGSFENRQTPRHAVTLSRCDDTRHVTPTRNLPLTRREVPLTHMQGIDDCACESHH